MTKCLNLKFNFCFDSIWFQYLSRKTTDGLEERRSAIVRKWATHVHTHTRLPLPQSESGLVKRKPTHHTPPILYPIPLPLLVKHVRIGRLFLPLMLCFGFRLFQHNTKHDAIWVGFSGAPVFGAFQKILNFTLRSWTEAFGCPVLKDGHFLELRKRKSGRFESNTTWIRCNWRRIVARQCSRGLLWWCLCVWSSSSGCCRHRCVLFEKSGSLSLPLKSLQVRHVCFDDDSRKVCQWWLSPSVDRLKVTNPLSLY